MCLKILDKICFVLMGLMMTLLLGSALWQVFSRLILKNPSLITEELSRYALIWAALLGAAFAFGRNAHLSLTLLLDKLSGRPKQVIIVFNEIIILLFAITVMIYGGFMLCQNNSNQLTAILRLPKSMVYAIIPIAGVLIVLSKTAAYVDHFLAVRKGAHTE